VSFRALAVSQKHMKLFKTLIAGAIAAALLVIPAAALAKSHDRDHDGMPDKWETKNHLNAHAKDARKDPDHDGLSNLSEFRHRTNPHKADTDGDGVKDGNEVRDDTNPRSDDSDGDGVEDGDEIAGTVTSFQGGVLTIQLAGTGAGTVSGTVNDQTRIECDDDSGDARTTTARMSDDGGGGDEGDDNQGDDNEQGDDNDQGDGDNEAQCTSADLKPGAVVHEAKLAKAADGSNVFTKIELIPAAS
jgi:hypothetical protein